MKRYIFATLISISAVYLFSGLYVINHYATSAERDVPLLQCQLGYIGALAVFALTLSFEQSLVDTWNALRSYWRKT